MLISGEKRWCQQNSRDVSLDLYIFRIFYLISEGITAKFHHCGICVTDFRWEYLKDPSWNIGLKASVIFTYNWVTIKLFQYTVSQCFEHIQLVFTCSKPTIEALRHQNNVSVNFKDIPQLFVVFLLLNLIK